LNFYFFKQHPVTPRLAPKGCSNARQEKGAPRNSRNLSFIYLLILVPPISIHAFPVGVHANVPVILDVSTVETGGQVSLDIKINHLNPSFGGYSADHYVDLIEVEVDGEPHQIQVAQPPTAETFTVTYYIGELTGYPTVRIRAHCTIHRWSEWSQPQVIPEFPDRALAAFSLSILSILIVVRRSLTKRQQPVTETL